MGQLKVSGDPRRPAEVKPYVQPPIPDPTGDVTMLGGLALGAIGLFFKSKLSAWSALLVCLSAAANAKTGQADVKGMVTGFSFAIMSIFLTYLPVPGQPMVQEPPTS